MASEVPSIQTPTISLTQGRHAPTPVTFHDRNTLPRKIDVSAPPPANQPALGQQPRQFSIAVRQQVPTSQSTQQQQQDQQHEKTDLASQVAVVNKYLNDSGRAATFRAASNHQIIEEVNPATGEVIAQYSATMFSALARSVGIAGARSAVDEHA